MTPGERRKVITGIPGKTGLIWTLDAATGEFLWARPTVYQNIMTGLDLATGRPSFDESTAPVSVRDPAFACPHLLGGKNQPSGAYSPDTGALYMPLNNACMDIAMSVEVRGRATATTSGSGCARPDVHPADVRGCVRQGRPRGPLARPDPRDAAARITIVGKITPPTEPYQSWGRKDVRTCARIHRTVELPP